VLVGFQQSLPAVSFPSHWRAPCDHSAHSCAGDATPASGIVGPWAAPSCITIERLLARSSQHPESKNRSCLSSRKQGQKSTTRSMNLAVQTGANGWQRCCGTSSKRSLQNLRAVHAVPRRLARVAGYCLGSIPRMVYVVLVPACCNARIYDPLWPCARGLSQRARSVAATVIASLMIYQQLTQIDNHYAGTGPVAWGTFVRFRRANAYPAPHTSTAARIFSKNAQGTRSKPAATRSPAVRKLKLSDVAFETSACVR